MKNFKIIILLVVLFATTNIYSQTNIGNGLNALLHKNDAKKSLNIQFPNRYCIYNIDNKEYVSLIMEVKANCDMQFVKKYDCFIGSKVGNIVTLRLNINQLDKFVKEKDIIDIETSRKIGNLMMDNAIVGTRADMVQQGIDLMQQYTGKDVIIGIADWGVDYTHPNFYDTTITEYRIIAAWDQFRRQGPAPEPYTYGTVFTTQEDLLKAQCDTADVYDTGYHATHVAGITGGGGAGTDLKGIAVEAKWLFCTWIPDEASIMDGYTWMRDVAKSQGKRLVINNSWGVYLFGYMDGTSFLDKFINTMSEEDSVVFVVSAGNNGGDKFHIKADFNQSDFDTLRSVVEFNIPYPFSKNYWGETITIQGENDAPFESFIEVYDATWQKIGQSPILKCDGSVITEDFILTEQGDSVIYRASSRFPSDNRPLVDWEVRKSQYINDACYVVLGIVADTGKIHAWNVACLTTGVGNWGLEFKSYNKLGYVQGDDKYGISEPALAEKTIAVGAYMYRKDNTWDPDITSFSSVGPTLTSFQKPDITAPGFSIKSSVSSFASDDINFGTSVTFDSKEYYFNSLSGTSMSCPMVSGAIALMLQANPNLTPDEVKDILIQTAVTDKYTKTCPNEIWGYGKMDVYNAVKMAEQKIGLLNIDNTSINIYPVPTKNILNINGIDNTAEILIMDVMGRQLIKTKGNKIDVSSLKNGIYLLNINDKQSIKRVKFIKN